MIGNTIGSLVADAVAGDGRPRAGRSTTGAGDGMAARPTPGVGGGQVNGSGDDAGFGDIVVTAQSSDAVYRPSDYGSLFQLAQYRPNPRARMGGNGGPPLNDPLVITQVFPSLQNAPGGAIDRPDRQYFRSYRSGQCAHYRSS